MVDGGVTGSFSACRGNLSSTIAGIGDDTMEAIKIDAGDWMDDEAVE